MTGLSASGGAGAAALDGLRILVVEDEPLIALQLEIVFEDAGADVLLSRKVSHAMDLIETRRIDAAILDVNLGSGITCEPIAERLRAKGIPFALHSGDLARLGELVVEIGAPVLSKPASEASLLAAVAALVPAGPQLS